MTVSSPSCKKQPQSVGPLQGQDRGRLTTHISLNAVSCSSDTTSSAMGISCKLYAAIVTSPSTPSSSSIRVISVDVRGTKKRVYVCGCDSRACRLIWSFAASAHDKSDCTTALTRYDLDVADARSAEIHDVRRRGRKRSWLEPEHLVHAMVLRGRLRSADRPPRLGTRHVPSEARPP